MCVKNKLLFLCGFFKWLTDAFKCENFLKTDVWSFQILENSSLFYFSFYRTSKKWTEINLKNEFSSDFFPENFAPCSIMVASLTKFQEAWLECLGFISNQSPWSLKTITAAKNSNVKLLERVYLMRGKLHWKCLRKQLEKAELKSWPLNFSRIFWAKSFQSSFFKKYSHLKTKLKLFQFLKVKKFT